MLSVGYYQLDNIDAAQTFVQVGVQLTDLPFNVYNANSESRSRECFKGTLQMDAFRWMPKIQTLFAFLSIINSLA